MTNLRKSEVFRPNLRVSLFPNFYLFSKFRLDMRNKKLDTVEHVFIFVNRTKIPRKIRVRKVCEIFADMIRERCRVFWQYIFIKLFLIYFLLKFFGLVIVRRTQKWKKLEFHNFKPPFWSIFSDSAKFEFIKTTSFRRIDFNFFNIFKLD